MDCWNEISKLNGKTLKTLDRGNPFDVIEVTQNAAVLRPHESGIERKVLRDEIESAYSELVSKGELTRVTIRTKYSEYNPAYVAALLALLPGVSCTTQPIHLRYSQVKRVDASAKSQPNLRNAKQSSSERMALEDELDVELRGTYDAARKLGYVATYFLQMLEEHGGKETAKRLLSKSAPQAGLSRLWELGLLNESMEAVVLQDRFRSLFTGAELAEAHRRLEGFGFFRKTS